MALTGTVAEVTPIGTNVEVLVKLPNGTAGRYVVSLLNPQIQATLQDLARQAVTPVNDALIKANLTLLVPGLELDLSDPVDVVIPPTEDDLARQAFSTALSVWLVARGKLLIDATDQGTVDGARGTVSALYAKGTPPQQALYDQILSIVRP